MNGLSTAQARHRLATVGRNRLVRRERGALLKEVAGIVADPMALMLAITGLAYLALGDRRSGYVMLAAIVPVMTVDVALEARARGALKRLAGAVAARARVVRDGVEGEIPTEEIVPGDLLLVREGDVVHADAIVRSQSNLAVDESQLSGESKPSDKNAVPLSSVGSSQAGEDCRLFAGSRVVAGHGCAEVTATGEHTRYGELARLVAEATERPTPLQRRTARMVRWMVGLAVAAAAGVFVLRWTHGVPSKDAFLYAITLAMSAVGEEFLLVLTLFLSVGAWRLSRHGVLVRRLASVETLGATTVICLDKTGTLTSGQYSLQAGLPLGEGVTEQSLLEAAVLACEPNAADAMERAILKYCAQRGVDVARLHERWRLVYDHPFDPVGKHMSHVWRRDDLEGGAQFIVVAKGAIEGILEHCEIAPAELNRARAAHAELAADRMRLLAVAARQTAAGSAGSSGIRSDDERNLSLLGLLGFHDPMRPQVPAAVAECERAGVRLKLITGDHPMTAHAIVDSAGIAHRNDLIITGEQLAGMTAEQLSAAAREGSVFARVQPEQKCAIVDALIASGEVVAMIGDGINDAPALRHADIGISMGSRGTEVARASADLVLLEDNFADLVSTISEGRRIYENIRRAFRYLVAFKVTLVGLALTTPLVGLPILLLPVDLVWLELIVHPMSALAFEGQQPAVDLMRRPPRDPSAPLLGNGVIFRSILTGALLTLVTLALYASRLHKGEDYARGAAMALIVAGGVVLAWAELAGAGDRAGWRAPIPRSPWFWGVSAVIAVTIPAFMLIRPIAQALHIGPIDPGDWALVALLAVGAGAWRAFGTGGSGKADGRMEALKAGTVAT